LGGALSEEYPGKKALIVTGGSSAERSGALQKIQDSLNSGGVVFGLLYGVEPDPSSETVERIAAEINKGYGILIPLGGGSTIDATKAANALAVLGGSVDDYIGDDKVTGKLKSSGKELLPVIAIPTTSGTGAEVTRFSVITMAGQKKPIRDWATMAKQAYIDPELTYSCPGKLTAAVGLDTLAHNLEGYLNNTDEDADPGANDRALFGLDLVFKYLPRAVRDCDDKEAREKLALASVLGGTVINYKPTSLPHGLSFFFKEQLAHGDAVSIILPYAWAFYLPSVQEKSVKVARLMGIEVEGREAREVGVEAVRKLIDFIRDLGHPVALKQVEGVDQDQINHAADSVAGDPMRLSSSPRKIEPEEAIEVFRAIMDGAFEGRIEDILKL
jgi:alcohol dehydrogenase class IV